MRQRDFGSEKGRHGKPHLEPGSAFGLAGGISPWLGGVATGIAGSLTSAFAAALFVVLYFEIRCSPSNPRRSRV